MGCGRTLQGQVEEEGRKEGTELAAGVRLHWIMGGFIYLSVSVASFCPSFLPPPLPTLCVHNQLFNMQFSQAVPPTLPTAGCRQHRSSAQLLHSETLQDICQGCILSAGPRRVYWSGLVLSVDAVERSTVKIRHCCGIKMENIYQNVSFPVPLSPFHALLSK